MTISNAPVVVAIDLGYGLTKYTRLSRQDGATKVHYDLFPSIALGVDRRRYELGEKNSDNVKVVSYKGESFVVGPDVGKRVAGSSDFGRHLDDKYYESAPYHALMRGALAYIGEDRIDVLALGLPVSHFRDPAKAAALRRPTPAVSTSMATGRCRSKRWSCARSRWVVSTVWIGTSLRSTR